MLSAESLETIRSEGGRILDLARRDPNRPVPQYPSWTLTDLLSHTASIHARTTLICRERSRERISAPSRPEGFDVFDWYEANLGEMVTALEQADPDTSVWGFVPDSTIGFWERRMLIETGVHRWDAGQAFGEEELLDEAVSAAGLDEFADMWLPRLGDLHTLEVTASDLGRSWVYGSGVPEATVSGTASDVYLRLMSRPSPVTLPEEWEAAVDSLEPPRK